MVSTILDVKFWTITYIGITLGHTANIDNLSGKLNFHNQNNNLNTENIPALKAYNGDIVYLQYWVSGMCPSSSFPNRTVSRDRLTLLTDAAE